MSDGNWTDKVAAFGAVKKVNWKNFAIPIVGLLIFVTLFAWRMTDKPSASKVADKTVQQAAPAIAGGVVDALTAKGILGPPVTTPTAAPNYDYLTCTHLPPKDITCVPLFTQPLTTEAKHLIGYQGGDVTGALNSDNTRDIVNQIRTLDGADQCTMYLGLVQDEHRLLRHKVFASQEESTTGSAKLYDCTPKSDITTMTAPTQGKS